MIQAVGIDVVLIERVKNLVQSYSEQLERIFTVKELNLFKGASFNRKCAECFAVKEAVFKVLGTGWQNGMSWTDIEVIEQKVYLTGKALAVAKDLNIREVQFDVSSTEQKAVAQAIGLTE